MKYCGSCVLCEQCLEEYGVIARIFILKMHVDRSFQCHFTVHHVDFAKKVDRFYTLASGIVASLTRSGRSNLQLFHQFRNKKIYTCRMQRHFRANASSTLLVSSLITPDSLVAPALSTWQLH